MNNLNKKSMQIPSFHHLLIFMFLFVSLIVHSQGCHDVERTALLTFKNFLEDPSNRLSSWQEGSHSQNCCNWHGIQCYSQHVISIDLRNRDYEMYLFNKHSFGLIEPKTSLKVKGQFFTSLLNITRLEYLDLGYNNFQGLQIPTEVSNLKKLIHLDLTHTDLSGSITTQFANLSFLRYLDISSSSMKSSSLSWVTGLLDLKVLRLSGVDLYEASSSEDNFVEPLLFLSNLSNLDLSLCKLQGSFPYLPQLKELDISRNPDLHVNLSLMFEHEWPKLQNLSISDTSVKGSIPSSISSNAQLLSHLDLSSNFITGYLPSSIFNLKHLQFLSLSKNYLQGPIPKSICETSCLQKLDLSKNIFTGVIPSCITKLQNLYYFDISSNSIEGVVSLIGWINNSNVTTLSLSSNRLTVHLDQHLQPSKFNLERLELRSCNLDGNIPPFICNMSHLDTLDLSDNHLSGPFPPCLAKLKNITSINLSRNRLTGTLPYLLDFGNDNHVVREMNFSSNNFRGPLPLPSEGVTIFDLSQNKFSGEITIEIGSRLFNSKYIYLSGNYLSGTIPFSICSHEHMINSISSLDLSDNKLSGNIPSSIGDCGSLLYLNLGFNNLSGSVPNELGQVKGLMYLILGDNSLSGSFPDSIQQLNSLEVINLKNNKFEGTLPSFVSTIFGLKIFSVRFNKFRGIIPNDITNLQDLQILDLSQNDFSGVIPWNIGNLKVLRSRPNFTLVSNYMYFPNTSLYDSQIDLSANSFEGTIPDEIGLLKGLFLLNLSHNLLIGTIPKSVGSMYSLDFLDLSFNKLSGSIPQSLACLDIHAYFNMSYNNLSGMIPVGNTPSRNPLAYLNNQFLLGMVTENFCKGNDTEPQKEDKEDAKEKLLLCAVVALGIGVGFSGPFLVMLVRRKWRFGYWRIIGVVATRVTRCVLKN